jgi:transposase
MAARIWNSTKQNRFLEMYKSGDYSTNEMAFELGVSQPTVYNHLRALQLTPQRLPRRYNAPGKVQFSDHEKQIILDCKAEGQFATDIAVRLGKSLQAVRRMIAELGLTNSNLLPLIVGTRYSSLIVLKPANPILHPKTGFRVARSIVRCDCGKELAVSNHTLRCGNNKSCGGDIHRLKPNTPWIRIMHQYIAGARQRGIQLNLSREQIKIVALMPCVYCNQVGSNSLQGRTGGRSNGIERARYNGIDQVIPCGGYDVGNIVPCCRICNRAKSNLSLTEFVAWLQSIGSPITESYVLDKARELHMQLSTQS